MYYRRSTKDENNGDLNHSRSLFHGGPSSATPNEHSNTSCWEKKARTARPPIYRLALSAIVLPLVEAGLAFCGEADPAWKGDYS